MSSFGDSGSAVVAAPVDAVDTAADLDEDEDGAEEDEEDEAIDEAGAGAVVEDEGLLSFALFVPFPFSAFVPASPQLPSARIMRPTASIAEGSIAPTATSATPATTMRVLLHG